MRRKRQIPTPKIVSTARLVSADHLRWHIANHPRWGHLTDEALGKELHLTGSYVGMILSGARPPTAAFLKAVGWEAVTLYQMKLRGR